MSERSFGLDEGVQVVEQLADAAIEAAAAMKVAFALDSDHLTKEYESAAAAINKLSAKVDEYILLLEDIRGA